jgi:hypothetical protein
MLLEISVLLQSIESAMLEKFDPQQGLALSCPKSHPFAPRAKVFALLGLASKAFFQLLNLI